ncbi:hypothetical protein L9F63_009364 [Diploptera punctata]|uniref:Uncharacterized protein n=1 Tax=Diploptera punctata TaxID=6984 RepID=A0AAD8AJR3_DIPPU|nr:hypothetical protein L9F63_009364 [Diploptera punctata]
MSCTFVTQSELERFISNCLMKVGVNVEHANISADVLAYKNAIDTEKRGLRDLTRIIEEIKKGIINPKAVPRILKELDSTKNGLCIVSATNSNSFECASYYEQLASNDDLIGFVCTNASNNVIVPRGTKSGFLLDMACSTTEDKLKSKKDEFNTYWALDVNGQPATKFEMFAFLQNLGKREGSEHKGFGLTLMVDVLSGLIGHCFIVINPGCFAPGFGAHMTEIMRYLRQMEPLVPGIPAIVPGDREKFHINEINDQGGIKLTEELVKMSNFLSTTLGVENLTSFEN